MALYMGNCGYKPYINGVKTVLVSGKAYLVLYFQVFLVDGYFWVSNNT